MEIDKSGGLLARAINWDTPKKKNDNLQDISEPVLDEDVFVQSNDLLLPDDIVTEGACQEYSV